MPRIGECLATNLESCSSEETAADWRRDTAFAAQMARELLWEKESDLALANFVEVSQRCVRACLERLIPC
jgi:hypothetical protein